MTARTVVPVVALEGVRKSYGRRKVIDDVSVSFQAGAVTALVGPNGAGKTTLLRIIAGLQFPDAGLITATRPGYFGGFDTLPLHGRVRSVWRGLGISHSDDKRRLSTLSRGELQWIGLEAIFALNCEALLLDEPWTGLEPDRKDDLSRRIVHFAREGNIVICATHDLDEVSRVADRVYFIGAGTIEVRDRVDGVERDALLQMYRNAQPPK